MFRPSSSLYRQSDLVSSFKTQGLQPIKISFPIDQDVQSMTIPGIDPWQTRNTIKKLREKEKHISKGVICKFFFLFFVGIIIFYLFSLLIALTLFNLVLMVILIVIFIKYLKWMFFNLKELRSNNNMKLIKKFLDEENRKIYSSKLIRFQLCQAEECIKIINLRFSP